MTRKVVRRFIGPAAGILLLAALAGCSGKGLSPGSVAEAASTGFDQSDRVDGIPIQLLVEPFQPGQNQFRLITDTAGITAVETQVIMMEMGHGGIIDLEPVAPGQYEASSAFINMEGRWMLRVKVTTAGGDVKLATFYDRVKGPE